MGGGWRGAEKWFTKKGGGEEGGLKLPYLQRLHLKHAAIEQHDDHRLAGLRDDGLKRRKLAITSDRKLKSASMRIALGTT